MANGALRQRQRGMGNLGPRPVIASPFVGWLPRSLWGRQKDPFIYSADFTGTDVLNFGVTRTVNISVQADSDFLIVAAVRVVTSTDNLTNVAFLAATVRITDQGSGRDLMDRSVHIENIFGTAQLPMYWPIPKVVEANSTLSTTLVSLETANNRNVRVSYYGFKIFGMPERQ